MSLHQQHLHAIGKEMLFHRHLLAEYSQSREQEKKSQLLHGEPQSEPPLALAVNGYGKQYHPLFSVYFVLPFTSIRMIRIALSSWSIYKAVVHGN